MTEVLAHCGTKADLSKEASANSRSIDNFSGLNINFKKLHIIIYLC